MRYDVSDQLAPHERSVFATLSAVLAEEGAVERDSLRVLVASRGGDLGREYIRLRDLGFVQEVETRPGFFARLFGVKAKRLVSLTARGRELAGLAVAVPEAAVAAPEPEVAAPVAEPVAEVVAEPVAEVAVEGPVVEPVAEPVVAPAVRAAAAKRQKKPRVTVADFTESVGGAPVDEAVALPEGERLDGLAETLGLMGFELMPAGRLLAAHRWAAGFADADVVLETLVVAVAHAARLDRTGTARLDQAAMAGVVDAVGAALGPLVAEGALGAAQLDESLGAMRAFLRGDAAVDGAVAALLDDPLRGLAPPAICPEGVWIPADDGGE